tara:strand:+ start:7 stop:891 length:885 start_codon:yes stop_codon:yes gene_type:complete
MVKILLTGASGHIGRNLYKKLEIEGHSVKAISRFPDKNLGFVYGNLSESFDWIELLKNIDVVIHCGALVHQMKPNKQTIDAFYNINFKGSVRLALQASQIVKRFIFISTLKVHGEEFGDNEISADDIQKPDDDYSRSKYLAEKELINLAQKTNMEYVIIRPPLVYSSELTGNLRLLSKLIKLGLPLPFGSLNRNKRSLVSSKNLVDFISLCVSSNGAANQAFIVRDQQMYNTKEIVKLVGKITKRNVHLFSVPESLLRIIFRILNKEYLNSRLFGNQLTNIRKNFDFLGWVPKD